MTRPADTLREHLARLIHDACEWQYDECDHGNYRGGLNDGQPYAMCEILAERIAPDLAALLDAAPDREALARAIQQNAYVLKHAKAAGDLVAPMLRPELESAERRKLAHDAMGRLLRITLNARETEKRLRALLAGTVPAPVADREAAKRVAAVLDARGEIEGENLCTVHIGRNKWLHLTVTDVRALLADGSTAERYTPNIANPSPGHLEEAERALDEVEEWDDSTRIVRAALAEGSSE